MKMLKEVCCRLHEADQETWIDIARQVMSVSPVATGRIPSWLKTRLKAAVKAKKLSDDGRYIDPLTSALGNAIDGAFVLDHWGTSRLGHGMKGEVFVSEPYDHEVDYKKVRKLCGLLNVGFLMTSNSWHYPGSTCRFILMRTEGES